VTLARNEPKAFLKATALIEELKLHPRTGTGKPKQLSGDRAEALRKKYYDSK